VQLIDQVSPTGDMGEPAEPSLRCCGDVPKDNATGNGGLLSVQAMSESKRSRYRLDRRGMPLQFVGTAVVVMVGFSGLVAAAAIARPLGAAAMVACLAALAWRRPGLLLALALNGFYVYLTVVSLSGNDRATTAYYAALGAALLVGVWRCRPVGFARAASASRLVRVWMLAAGVLAAWFVINGFIFRAGDRHEVRVVVAELAAVTVPSVLLAFSLADEARRDLLRGMVLLGCAFVVADAIALAQGTQLVSGRFTPIAAVDPITAGLVPAYAGAALLALEPPGGRARMLWLALVATLVAAAVLPGSRGPAAVVIVTAAVALVRARRRGRGKSILGAVAVGVAVAWIGASTVGSSRYLTSVPTTSAPAATSPGAPEKLSTIRIRWYWLKDAIAAVPDKPWLGHGLISLPDTSPDAYLMHVNGEFVYPHNDVVEAIYSLGVVGFVPFFITLVGAPVLLLRRRGWACAATLLFVAAFVESNFSGEIGTDSLLWASVALLAAARVDADEARRHAPELERPLG
jgi:O-antigen ligase